MKSTSVLCVGITLLAISGALLMTPTHAETQSPQVLRHVVLFKFKPEATEQQIQKIVDAVEAFPERIAEVDSLEWGINNSQEGRSKGFTHCFLLTFKTQADLDAYLPHPVHKEFIAMALPSIEDVTVVDYWAQ